jgi:hypothetical protein
MKKIIVTESLVNDLLNRCNESENNFKNCKEKCFTDEYIKLSLKCISDRVEYFYVKDNLGKEIEIL